MNRLSCPSRESCATKAHIERGCVSQIRDTCVPDLGHMNQRANPSSPTGAVIWSSLGRLCLL